MIRRRAYSDLFARLAGRIMQCSSCDLARPFIAFGDALRSGWAWSLAMSPGGARIQWTCPECGALAHVEAAK